MNTRRYLITITATAALAIGVSRVAADKPLAPTAAMPAQEAAAPAGEPGARETLPRQAPAQIAPEK